MFAFPSTDLETQSVHRDIIISLIYSGGEPRPRVAFFPTLLSRTHDQQPTEVNRAISGVSGTYIQGQPATFVRMRTVWKMYSG